MYEDWGRIINEVIHLGRRGQDSLCVTFGSVLGQVWTLVSLCRVQFGTVGMYMREQSGEGIGGWLWSCQPQRIGTYL